VFRYRLVIHAGAGDASNIEKAFGAFANSN
jgi:hypothetical protein